MEAPISTDADRLEAAGVSLRLGERDVRVRFTMRSMKQLEKQYGSLVAVNEQLHLLVKGDHPTPHDAITEILPAGLLHEPGAGAELLDISPREYPACLDALVLAISESFPDASGKAEEADALAEASPGQTSTSSAPSDSAAATGSSGT